MITRLGPIVLLEAATPATSATALEPFRAQATSLKLLITTVTGGAGTLTITAETSVDETTYFDVIDRDSAWSTTTSVIDTAGTYDFDLTGLKIADGDWVRLSYSCTTAAGTIAIDAINYEDTGGSSSVETGDIIADLDDVETLITAGNAILTTIDADTGVIAGDTTSIDAKTPALGTAAMAASSPITIATDDTMFTALDTALDIVAGDTTSLDAKQPALGTAAMAASIPVTLATDDTMTAAANALLGTIDADTSSLATTVTGGTTSQRVEEIDPLSAQYAATSLIANEAVATALDSYAPSASGQAWGGYGPLSLQVYILGGVKTGPSNVTVTVKVEATNGGTVSAAVDWVDITESVKSLLTGVDSAASYTSTGATAYRDILTVRREDSNFTHFRVKYTFDNTPTSANGAVVVMARGAAL